MLTVEQIDAKKAKVIADLIDQLPRMLHSYLDMKMLDGWNQTFPEFVEDWDFTDDMFKDYGECVDTPELYEASAVWLEDWSERIGDILQASDQEIIKIITYVIMTQVEAEEEEMAQC